MSGPKEGETSSKIHQLIGRLKDGSGVLGPISEAIQKANLEDTTDHSDSFLK